METNEVIVIDDALDLHGAPHTVHEIVRESLSTVPEKTEEELYLQPVEEEEVTTPSPDDAPSVEDSPKED